MNQIGFCQDLREALFAIQYTSINCLNLPWATAEFNLPDEKNLFHLYDNAFVNQYFGQ